MIKIFKIKKGEWLKMPEIEGIYYETEEDYYMILDELYKDGKEVI